MHWRAVVHHQPPAGAVVHEYVRRRDLGSRKFLGIRCTAVGRTGRLQDVLVDCDPADVSDDAHLLVGEHELDVRRVAKDCVPRREHLRPAAQAAPPRMRDDNPVRVLPYLSHRIEVARLERRVERRVRGPHLLGTRIRHAVCLNSASTCFHRSRSVPGGTEKCTRSTISPYRSISARGTSSGGAITAKVRRTSSSISSPISAHLPCFDSTLSSSWRSPQPCRSSTGR